MKSNFFIDTSELVSFDAQTGIQRVVKNILFELLLSDHDKYKFYPVYLDKNLDKLMHVNFSINGSTINLSKNFTSEVLIEADDIFLGLDLSLNFFPEFNEILKKIKLKKGKIFFLVYDLIPLKYPHFYSKDTVTLFKSWLDSILLYSDGIICDSDTVKNDLKKHLSILDNSCRDLPISFFHLGANFIKDSKLSNNFSYDNKYDHIFNNSIVFLMVGTIEPRKNTALILNIFNQLWSMNFQAKLILVGKEGWLVDKIISKIENSEYINNKLFWFKTADDELLDFFYKKSSALIAMSADEGFGLPLAEAAFYELPIIANDIPVFREVIGDSCFYLNANNKKEVLNFFISILAEKKFIIQHNFKKQITWLESSHNLIRSIDDFMRDL